MCINAHKESKYFFVKYLHIPLMHLQICINMYQFGPVLHSYITGPRLHLFPVQAESQMRPAICNSLILCAFYPPNGYGPYHQIHGGQEGVCTYGHTYMYIYMLQIHVLIQCMYMCIYALILGICACMYLIICAFFCACVCMLCIYDYMYD